MDRSLLMMYWDENATSYILLVTSTTSSSESGVLITGLFMSYSSQSSVRSHPFLFASSNSLVPGYGITMVTCHVFTYPFFINSAAAAMLLITSSLVSHG